MPDSAFTKTQINQLGKLMDDRFDKNNKMIALEFSRVVDSMSEVVNETEARLKSEIENLRGEMKSGFQDVNHDIKNLALTMASKYEVKDLDR